MEIIEKMKVKKITDTTTKREGKEEAQIRTITLDSESMAVTIKAAPEELEGINAGDIVEIRISRE